MSDHDAMNKSAAELEREVEMQRSRVSSTLDELQTKMSPGELLDGFMDYTKGGSTEFVQNLGRSVRDNPLPVALVGAGLVWLMTGSGKPHGHDSARYSAGYAPGDSDAWRSQAYASGNGHGEGLLDKARHMGEDFGDAAKHMGEGIGDTARHLGEGLAGAASGAVGSMHNMRHGLGDAAQGLMEKGRRQTESLAHLYEDQPLIGGAVAFALGAALGAMLPHTRQEDELLGEAADSMKEEAMAAAGDLLDEGRHAVEETYADIKGKVGEAIDDATTRRSEDGTGQYSL